MTLGIGIGLACIGAGIAVAGFNIGAGISEVGAGVNKIGDAATSVAKRGSLRVKVLPPVEFELSSDTPDEERTASAGL
jgi:hypothetical protein